MKFLPKKKKNLFKNFSTLTKDGQYGYGFDFEVESVPRSEVYGYSKCGGYWRAQNEPQKFASPNFPKYYDPNLNCKYIIQMQNSDLLYLKFHSFK